MLSKQIVEKIQANIKTYTMIMALALIWLLFGFLTDWIFFSPRNLSNLFRQMTIVSFLAVGMVLVIVTNHIDLSVGSAAGLVSAVTAYIQAVLLPPVLEKLIPGLSIEARGVIVTIIAILVGLAVGLLIGLWQGTLIAYLRIPAFVVIPGRHVDLSRRRLGITRGRKLLCQLKMLFA